MWCSLNGVCQEPQSHRATTVPLHACTPACTGTTHHSDWYRVRTCTATLCCCCCSLTDSRHVKWREVYPSAVLNTPGAYAWALGPQQPRCAAMNATWGFCQPATGKDAVCGEDSWACAQVEQPVKAGPMGLHQMRPSHLMRSTIALMTRFSTGELMG